MPGHIIGSVNYTELKAIFPSTIPAKIKTTRYFVGFTSEMTRGFEGASSH